jgi:predicted nucleic acid-binding protein
MEEAVVVTDAGPILHLHWIGATEWALPQTPIVVVETVWREIEAHELAALGDPRLQRVGDPTSVPRALQHPDLHPGERAALAYAVLASGSAAVEVLCDDMSARRACRELGLPHTGTVGLILEARASGTVSYAMAADALRELPVTGGLWLHPRLLKAALLALRRD